MQKLHVEEIMEYIQFIIQGNAAREAAEEIRAILNTSLGAEAILVPPHKPPSDGNRKAIELGDAVALGSLVLSIPATLLAAGQLIDKLAKRKQVDDALGQIQTQVVHRHRVTVKIKSPDGTVKEISKVDTIRLIDRGQGK